MIAATSENPVNARAESARGPRRVVHLVEDLGTGGLERNLALIVEHLDRSKFDPEVWCLEEGGSVADELQSKGVAVRILHLASYHRPSNLFRLARLLREKRVEILHSHAYFANTMGRLAAILARTPRRIAHVQNSHWTRQERHSRHYLVDRLLSYACDFVVSCSEMARNFQIERAGIPPAKIVTIHNSIDPVPYTHASGCIRSELGLESHHKVVTSVARLTRLKGHHYLLEAMVEIRRRMPEVRLLIAGQGPERAQLQSQLEALALTDCVTLLGERRDIPSILADTDLFVQPTVVREGLPLSILEAMASARPVVATAVGGVAEAVEPQRTGVLVPPGNAAALATGILALLRDPERCRRMGEEGRQRCLDLFTVDQMIRKIETLYNA